MIISSVDSFFYFSQQELPLLHKNQDMDWCLKRFSCDNFSACDYEVYTQYFGMWSMMFYRPKNVDAGCVQLFPFFTYV